MEKYAVIVNGLLIDSKLTFSEATDIFNEYKIYIVDADRSGIVPMDEILQGYFLRI